MMKKATVCFLLVVVVLGNLSAVTLNDAKRTTCSYARVNPSNVKFSTAQQGTLEGYEVYNVAFTVDDTDWQFAVDKESGDIVQGTFKVKRPPMADGQKTISQDKAKSIAINEVPGDKSDFYGFSYEVKKVKDRDCWRVSFNDDDMTTHFVYVDMVTGKVLRTESF